MGDNKALWEKVRSITNWETRQMMSSSSSSKPFKPRFLDVILSELAPHFYSEQELLPINNLHHKLQEALQLQFGTTTTTTNTIKKKQSVVIINPTPIQETIADQIDQEEIEGALAVPAKKQSRKRRHIGIDEDKMLIDIEEAPKPAKKSRKKIASEHVQDLPAQFMKRIEELNGVDLRFRMGKKLYETDVKANNNRLSMPEKNIKCYDDEIDKFLTVDEMGLAVKPLGLEVTVLDPTLREYPLLLKKWKMNTAWVYNLAKDWNRVVADNHFQEDHELQIWSFRVNTKLYFVLNKL